MWTAIDSSIRAEEQFFQRVYVIGIIDLFYVNIYIYLMRVCIYTANDLRSQSFLMRACNVKKIWHIKS